MSDRQSRDDAPADPEGRAFSGGPDMPPAEPDQPASGNEELLRGERDPSEDAGDEAKDAPEADRPGKSPRGEYGNLPGYGG